LIITALKHKVCSVETKDRRSIISSTGKDRAMFFVTKRHPVLVFLSQP
jgi:hypothetical protein